MRPYPSLGLGLALIVAAAGLAVEPHTWVALVTQVQGQASVTRPSGQQEPLHPLTRLSVGDKLNIPAGAQAVVAFLQGGQRFTVTRGTEILATSVSDTSAGRVATLNYVATLMPSGSNLDRLGGVSSQHQAPMHNHYPAPSTSPAAPPPLSDAPGAPAPATVAQPVVEEFEAPQVTTLSLALNSHLGQCPRVHVQVGNRDEWLPVQAGRVNLEKVQSQLGDPGHAVRVFVTDGGPGHEVFLVSHPTPALLQTLRAARADAMAAYKAHPTDPSPLAFLTTRYEEAACYDAALAMLQELRSQVRPEHQVFVQGLIDTVQDDLTQLQVRATNAAPRP